MRGGGNGGLALTFRAGFPYTSPQQADLPETTRETDLPTKRSRPQAPPRFPGAQGDQRGHACARAAPGQGAQAPVCLNPFRYNPDEALEGTVICRGFQKNRVAARWVAARRLTHPGPIDIMDRLKKRRDFLAAARGKKAARPGLVLQARAHKTNDTPILAPLRVGFTVTRKVGNAVTRNRAKRRLRAVAENIIPACGQAGYDYVLIGRAGTLSRPYSDLINDLKMALRRVHATAPAGATQLVRNRPHG